MMQGSVLYGIEVVDDLMNIVKKKSRESVSLDQSYGRILGIDIRADRDSPGCDVSAMDGYAVKIARLSVGVMPVIGEIFIGKDPGVFEPDENTNQVMKIFTGGPVPAWADAVIKREDTIESEGAMSLAISIDKLRVGQHVRRKGENGQSEQIVLKAGARITPPVAAVLASYGYAEVEVYCKVKVGILTTGDELKKVTEPVADWEIRDSNSFALSSLFSNMGWVICESADHVIDDLRATEERIRGMIEDVDVLLITGGVSMGDHDYVPAAVKNIGGHIVFHKVGIRPGKPLLGCTFDEHKKVIFGLPGNPVSVMVTARRFALPIIKYLAGFEDSLISDRDVMVIDDDVSVLDLIWFRPVKLGRDGSASLVKTKGSGDMIGTACSDGFVEVPPNQKAGGLREFYSWGG